MPNVTSKSFTQLVSDFATAVQGAAATLLDFGIGSILLAIGNAIAAVVVWLESLILTLLQTTRAATSNGADLDTWVNDYGVTRLPAVAATGQVTFARFTPTVQASIAAGSLVQTADGTQAFVVIADATQSAWNAGANAYVIPAGTSSISATVQAVSLGAQGNVGAGTITTLSTAIPYVDTVTNAAAFASGVNAETDGALRTRFIAYLASLSKATKGAIGNAMLSLQQGVSYSLTENYAYNGTYQPGYFYVVVDDGSGAPSSTFLASAANAVDAVRPFTMTFGVFAPVTQTANVVMSASIGPGYDATATKALVRTAVQSYLAGLTLGVALPYTRLAQVAYDASPGVVGISGLTLNGGTADLVVTGQQRVVPGTVTVN